ncbi:Metabotropic glutamate receptor 4 [Holothuria leucospilota]|uniref:Metabotropic glutamate receptor 4 n=1 Tax=Holothuria leucospilota TaxID=206669 RepID=A0A9Q0YRF8_HOLLE|nr:Metabotropic glutamate receptor 4 [Holothuria leucospilota]
MTAKCDGDIKVYKKDGDLIIGGLLGVHDYDEKTNTCGNLSNVWAPARAEAIAYAVSMLNNDSNILDGLTLGYEIYDTCDSIAETIRHTLNFIPGLRERDDVIGIVGPPRSASCIHVSTILSLYNVSMISHLATSDELSNGQRFPYFLRTVPPDKFQVSAIADILVEYGWKYVAFLYADDSYGKNAENEFSMQTKKKEICIGYSRSVPDSADDNFFNNIVNDLLTRKKDSLLSVVILFILRKDVRLLFKQAMEANLSEDFIWIASDGWGSFGLDPVKGLEESAVGAITISPKAEPNPEFSSFFIKTVYSSRNPWIPEFVRDSKRLKEQFPHELPTPSYESTIIDSVEVLARGIDALRKNICDRSMNISTCRAMLFRNRKLLRDHLLDVTFESSSNGLVTFTENGDSRARYDIWYLEQTEMDVYRLNNVGSWLQDNASGLQLDPLNWYLKEESTANGFTYSLDNIPKSVCRDPCVRSIQRFINNHCCWECEACKDNEIIRNNTCVSCFIREKKVYMWPNENLTYCVPLDKLKLQHEGDKIAILIITSLCIVAEFFVTYLYIKNREKRLIKASSRELGYIILVGVFLSYLSAILYSTPSSLLNCLLRRIIPNIGTAFIYIPLATMTVRLYRIFRSGMRTTQRTKFISPKSQVLLTFFLSMIPVSALCNV